MKMIVKKLEI